MNKWIIPIILTLLLAGTIVGVVFALKIDVFTDVKSKADCEDPQKTKLPASCKNDNNCCAVWDSGMCRKGKINGNVCESKSNPLPLVLILIALGLLVADIVYIVKAVKHA